MSISPGWEIEQECLVVGRARRVTRLADPVLRQGYDLKLEVARASPV